MTAGRGLLYVDRWNCNSVPRQSPSPSESGHGATKSSNEKLVRTAGALAVAVVVVVVSFDTRTASHSTSSLLCFPVRVLDVIAFLFPPAKAKDKRMKG